MYQINKKRLVNSFVNLAKISSPSWNERNIIAYLEKRFKELKVKHTLYKCGVSHNVLASLKGTRPGTPILFSCHMDTVGPCDFVRPVVTGSKISSDGKTILGSDDKAAIAVFLETIQYIKENKIDHGPIEFLFSCAEEVGLQGIKQFDCSKLNSQFAFVFDSDGTIGKVIVEAPYHSSMEIFISGKAAHAGLEPENGINAIRVLSEIIASIPHGRIDEKTTVNVGSITGGSATNIVAEQASCLLEVRSISASRLKQVEKEIRDVIIRVTKRYGAKAKVIRELEYSGFSIKPNQRIVKIIQKAAKRIKIKTSLVSSGGGSDTNILNRAGIKAINLSIGMQKVHSKKEFILIRDLMNGTKLAISIIESV